MLSDTVKAQNKKIYLWHFASQVQKVCIGVYPKIESLFIESQTLDDLIKCKYKVIILNII